MKKKVVFYILGILLLTVLAFVGKTLYRAGEFKRITPLAPGDCHAVAGVLSSEDMAIDRRTGLVFISSDDRRAVIEKRPAQRGAVIGYNLADPVPALVDLTREFKKEFHPHGLSLFRSPDGRLSLFVINHTEAGHFIEIFDMVDKRLVHRRGISDPLMNNPNDLLAVGPDRFYVTNDHGSSSDLGRTVEDYLQLSRAGVVYFDGSRFSRVVDDLSYANGIEKSPDGRTVYVAETLALRIGEYGRDPENGALTLKRHIDLGTGVDNIMVGEQGSLIVGCHPKLLTFSLHARDPGKQSPSQVLKIAFNPDRTYRVEEIFLSRGETLSGSSVATIFKGKLLIGSVFDGRFLVCDMRQGG
ncbi:MAG: SMP-30/gluconolactonase/LRE family protein [Proteobacteria bacterium]|nr:SMP-30/gluconolactonase/LRE family protein [Pseudomonadota bacterium]